jgi:hypothetical protein
MPRYTAHGRAVATALLLAASLPSTAAADEVSGTRSNALAERSHEIHLVLDHGVATLRARRTVYNGGERHDQAIFWLDVPEGAVATGLRTKDTLHGRPRWRAGELLAAELAAVRYRELTGMGPLPQPKDPALLSWQGPSLLALQVFPVAPRAEKTVEYTLAMATHYEDGCDRLELPALGTEALAAHATVRSAHPRDSLLVDDEPVASGHSLVLDQVHVLALARHRAPRIAARLASLPFADGRLLMRYEVDLAPRLSTIPADARVVVVLDGSFSLTTEQREVARATARAYLEHFADPRLRARAELLVFDRRVKAHHGRLVPVSEAIATLERLELSGANGSRVDDALDRTRALLAGRGGPRRILLLTDARTREALTPARLRALTERSRAIVHVAVVSPGATLLERDDQHPWAEAATATGGLVWRLAADPDEPREELRAAFEGLARPTRLDHLELSLPPLDHPAALVPSGLDEGQGTAALAVVDHAVDHLRIEGELWSRPLRATVRADADEGRRWAALVFGSELVDELTPAEMLGLAMHGGAVSPVTSYLVSEPGVRPSSEGLGETGSWGHIGKGGGGGTGTGYGRGIPSVGFQDRDGLHAALERRVRELLDTCGGRGVGARMELETTVDEIVEVGPPELRGSSDETLRACLVDAAWAIELGPMFDEDWRRWVIDLSASPGRGGGRAGRSP